MTKPELLAPAGTIECLETALDFGADAVYTAGRSFGLRASCPNLSEEELEAAVKMVHEKDRRIYIAVNAMVREGELDSLEAYLSFLGRLAPDGIIFSDSAIAEIHARLGLHVPLHLSTQASTMNSAACSFWKNAGVSRVILAREATLEEIEAIHAAVPDMELEAFVHGAMCIAFSGRCLLSSIATGRSGNRGECAQPCRWEYEIREKGSDDLWMDAEEDSSGTYIFNSKDLMMLDRIADLAKAGVHSLKIEGRMKSAYYVASVVHAYRRAIDLYFETGENAPQELLEELEKSATRTYTRGFFYGPPGASSQDTKRRVVPRRYTFAARVLSSAGGGYIRVEQRNKFSVGDTLEILSPDSDGMKFTVTEILTESGECRQSAPHAQEILLVRCPEPVRGGEILRRPEPGS